MQDNDETYQCCETETEIHIVNDKHDIYSHQLSKFCWCKPSVIATEEDKELYTHRPIQ